jgi:hypothetical protein
VRIALTMLLAIFSVFVLTTCGPTKGIDVSKVEEENRQWSVVQSPITGKCYEVMTIEYYMGDNSVGYSGMSEVSCKYLKK